MATERELSRNYRACEEALRALDSVPCHIVGNLFYPSIGGEDRELIMSLIDLVRDRIALRKDAVGAELDQIECGVADAAA
jgi:hypothetical protein